MKTYDLIRELRNGVPDRKKAVRLMTKVGVVCLFVALWNVAMFFFDSEVSHKICGLIYFYTGFFTTGFMFLFSAYSLKHKASWGKKISQLSILAFVFLMFMSVFLLGKSFFNFSENFGEDSLNFFPILMFISFSLIFLAQSLIPAHYGIHYLNRLESDGERPLNEKNSETNIFDNAENTKLIRKDKLEITKNKIKIACLIFIVEMLFIFSTGPAVILWAKATKSRLGNNTMLKYSDEYEPIDKNNAPLFYNLVKVTYNDDNTVRSEEYYTWTGSIETIDYEGNKTSAIGSLYVCNIVLGIFALLGLTLMGMQGIKTDLLPYGVIIFGSAFIIGAARLSVGIIFYVMK